MKRLTTFTFFWFWILSSALSQNPYYDALKLEKLKNEINESNKVSFTLEDIDTLAKILLKYYPKATNYNDIEISFHDNPFIHLPINQNTTTQLQTNSLALPKIIGQGYDNLSNLDVTTLADGFAKFIVARTKLELNMAFFYRFQSEIMKDEYKDMRSLFPLTFRALSSMGNEVYNYEGYLQTLRQCFISDLNSLPDNLPDIIYNNPKFFDSFPEMKAYLRSGCYIAKGLRDKIPPGEILKEFPDSYLNNLSLDIQGSIQTLKLISNSLQRLPVDENNYWVSTNSLRELIEDPIAFRIYLGLLYQWAKYQYDSVKFNTTTLVVGMDTLAKNYNRDYPIFAMYLKQFGEKADALGLHLKGPKPKNDSAAVEYFSRFTKLSLDIFKQASQAGKLPYINLPQLADTLDPFFNITQASCDLTVAINRRNYGGAITNCVYIYNTVITKNTTITEKEYNDAKKEITEKIGNAAIEYAKRNGNFNNCPSINSETREKLDTSATILYYENVDIVKKTDICKAKKAIKDTIGKLAIYSIERYGNINGFSFSNKAELQPYVNTIYSYTKLESIPKLSKETINKIYKYGTFMATVAQAKTSEEVKEAIDAIALPPGSARTKRESAFNVSLNAYCGIYAGYEKIRGIDQGYQEVTFNKWNSYGITAPIGIAVSKGFSHMSGSIFVSVVDIGALAAFRFADDSTSTAPKVELKDIISPGVFFSYGFPNCPISVNVGYQLGPLLRNVTATQNSYNNSYTRFSVSICVDIPVLNLYNKPH